MEKLENLLKYYPFYNENAEFYKNLIEEFNDYEAIVVQINKLIENDIENLNLDWFVNFLMKDKEIFLPNLRFIMRKLTQIGVKIDYQQFKEIIKKYPILNQMFEKIFNKKLHVRDEDIIQFGVTDPVINLLFYYAILKDIYYDETLGCEDEELDGIYNINIVPSYIGQIAQIPMLDKEEITELFIEIEKINQELNLPLTEEEKQRLLQIKDDIKNRIIIANLRLVVYVVYKNRKKGMEMIDLIQEGNLGLISAVEKYDYKCGIAFSTYAHIAIERAIRQATYMKRDLIRIPERSGKILDKIYGIKRARNIGDKDINFAEVAESFGLSVETVEEIYKNRKKVLSIDYPIEEDGVDKSYFIASPMNVEEELIERIESQEISKTLSYFLSPREETIVRLRFGFFDKNSSLYNEEHSLEEIGKLFNITKTRVGQILKKSLEKLRSVINDPMYLTFYENSKIKEVNTPDFEKSGSKTLSEILNCNENVLRTLALYNMGNPEFQILFDIFGIMLKNSVDFSKLSKEDNQKILNICILLKKQIKYMAKPTSLKLILGLTSYEMFQLRISLNKNSKYYEILSNYHGENLTNLTCEINALPYEYFALIYQLKKEIYENREKNRMKVRKAKYTLCEFLNCDENELAIILNVLDEKSYIFLKIIFGKKLINDVNLKMLESSQKERLTSILNLLNGRLQELRFVKENSNNNKTTSQNNEENTTVLIHPYFKRFIELLPIEIKDMTALRLGLNGNNKMHSLTEIAQTYNISIEEATKKVTEGVNLFVLYIKRYQELFGKSKKLIEEQTAEILKLIL